MSQLILMYCQTSDIPRITTIFLLQNYLAELQRAMRIFFFFNLVYVRVLEYYFDRLEFQAKDPIMGANRNRDNNRANKQHGLVLS